MNEEDTIKKALNISRENTSEYMSGLLMDPEWSTYKMFENLASDYLNGNKDVRFGIDAACSALTGWKFISIAERMIKKYGEA